MNTLQNIKMWYHNNFIKKPGKRGGKSFIYGLMGLVALMVGLNFPLSANAYSFSLLSANSSVPVNELINDALNGLKFNRSFNINTGIPMSPVVNPSQGTDFSKFFSSSNISSTDVTKFLKEAVVTAINLFILVITITIQVLKGLLSVINT